MNSSSHRQSMSGLEKKVRFLGNLKNYFSNTWNKFRQYVPYVAGGLGLAGIGLLGGSAIFPYVIVGAACLTGAYIYGKIIKPESVKSYAPTSS